MLLQIKSQPGKLGLNIKPHTFQLQQAVPLLNLNPTKPAIILDVHHPSVQIDQREQFDQLGRRYPVSMARFYGNKGEKISMQGIARRVSEGRRLADIHKPVSVAEVTANRELYPRSRKLTIEALPRTRPKIEFAIRDVQVDVTKGEVNGTFNYGKVAVESRVGQVEAYLLQKPDMQINYLGKAIDFAI